MSCLAVLHSSSRQSLFARLSENMGLWASVKVHCNLVPQSTKSLATAHVSHCFMGRRCSNAFSPLQCYKSLCPSTESFNPVGKLNSGTVRAGEGSKPVQKSRPRSSQGQPLASSQQELTAWSNKGPFYIRALVSGPPLTGHAG